MWIYFLFGGARSDPVAGFPALASGPGLAWPGLGSLSPWETLPGGRTVAARACVRVHRACNPMAGWPCTAPPPDTATLAPHGFQSVAPH